MKLDLFESGIQNMRSIAKKYDKAIIYFHVDLDGVTSALSAKYYLQQYGIETVGFQKIQYGSMEYAIKKVTDPTILPVLVDFSHGKSFMKIHTDHHDGQIAHQGSSQQFRHSKSNADTLSSIISTANIFPPEDIRIINMIDSAGYKEEDVNQYDMIRATVKSDPSLSPWRNHLNMGMACGKLLLAYKNKPGFLETVVMQSKPSLQSMYNVIVGIIKKNVEDKVRGWTTPEKIEQNSKEYFDSQSERKIKEGNIDSIDSMNSGQTILIGNTIFQVGGGSVRKTGSYDRYTAFRLYPNAKYFIMLWNTLGMMQVSKNPWGDGDDIHLGHLVLDDVFNKKYAKYMRSDKYKISLLAIKMMFEKDVKEDNETEAIGFNFEEFDSLFDNYMSKVNFTDKQKYVIQKWMSWKPSQFKKVDGDDKKNNEIDRAIKMLSSLYIPLPDIVNKLSGGHPAITNLTGFDLYDINKKLNYIIANGGNPYEKSDGKTPSDKKKKIDGTYLFKTSEKFDSGSTKILKSIAKDVIKKLNK